MACAGPGTEGAVCCHSRRLRLEQGGHRPRQESLLFLWDRRVHGARGGEPAGTHTERRLVVLRRAHGNGFTLLLVVLPCAHGTSKRAYEFLGRLLLCPPQTPHQRMELEFMCECKPLNSQTLLVPPFVPMWQSLGILKYTMVSNIKMFFLFQVQLLIKISASVCGCVCVEKIEFTLLRILDRAGPQPSPGYGPP